VNSGQSRAGATVLTGLSLALFLSSPAGAETRSDLRFLISYFSGDFGTGIQTHIIYVPWILVVTHEKHEFRLTVPYLSVTTSEPVTFVGDQVIGRGPGGSMTESGPGDVVLQDEYFFVEGGRARPWVSVLLRAKLPTADESRGLGTGEPDGGAGFGLIQPLGKWWDLLAQTQYVVRGDPPGSDFRNTLWLSIGIQRRLSGSTSANLFYERRQSVLPGLPDLEDLSLGCDHSFARKLSLRAAAYLGLSETAEDYGISAGISLH
jgi:outer membrane putative beta-barrel porin/alpha-amylase